MSRRLSADSKSCSHLVAMSSAVNCGRSIVVVISFLLIEFSGSTLCRAPRFAEELHRVARPRRAHGQGGDSAYTRVMPQPDLAHLARDLTRIHDAVITGASPPVQPRALV